MFRFDDQEFADSVERLEAGEQSISQSRALLLALVEQIVNGDMEPSRKLAAIEKAMISDIRLRVQERKDDIESSRLLAAENVRGICSAVAGVLMDQMEEEMHAGNMPREVYERIVDQFQDRFVAHVRDDEQMQRLFPKQIQQQQ